MIRAQTRFWWPLVFITVIGLTFLAAGAFAFYYQYVIVSQWPQVDAEVTRSELHRSSSPNGTLYRAEWEFRYIVAGREYRTPVQSHTRTTSYDGRKPEADRFAAGTHHLIRYDPADPNTIETNAAYTLGFFALPLIFGGIGLGVALLGFYLMKWIRPSPMLECASCGQTVEPEYKFCPQCAAKIPLRERATRDRTWRSAPRSPAALWIVGGVFTAVGLAALGFGVWAATRDWTVIRTWPEVEAQVINSALVRSRSINGDFRYRVRADFRYIFGGAEFTSPGSNSGFDWNNYSYVRRKADLYAPDTQHPIRVNPADPKDIRFDVGYTLDFFSTGLFLSVFGLIFATVGLGILLAAVRKSRLCASCKMPIAKAYRFCPHCAVAQNLTPLAPA